MFRPLLSGLAVCLALLPSRVWAELNSIPTLSDGSLDASQFPSTFTPAEATGSPSVTFFDGNFSNSAWSVGPVLFDNKPGTITQTKTQVLTGGNPGAYWQNTGSSAASGATGRYEASYFNPAAVYSPSTQGAIISMSGGFTQDLLSFTGVSDVFGTSILLMQNAAVYRPQNWYGLQDVSPGWYGSATLFSDTNIPVSNSFDWSLATGSGAAHPNFSATGSPITFGLLADTYFNYGSGTLVGGVDNWTINLYAAPVPEPSTLALALAFPLLARRRKTQNNHSPL